MTDWLPEITDDLNTLLEALEAWEAKDAASELLSDVVEGMLFRGDVQGAAEAKRQRLADKAQRERAKHERKERSIMLRAKLLTLRNRRQVDRTIDQSRQT